MFSFFGLFTNEAPGLPNELLAIWPDCEVVEMASPFCGLGVRFSNNLYEPEKEDIPENVSEKIKQLSNRRPEKQFILLRTECYGGPCFNWGVVIQKGEVIYNAYGQGALRRLVAYLGGDLGEGEVFEPLTRTFSWNSVKLRRQNC